MKNVSAVVKNIGPDLFSTGTARDDERTVKILSDLDSAAARVDAGSDVVGSRAVMLLFFAVVIPAVFTLALWHREQTEALEVRMSSTREELQPVVVPEARSARKDAVASNSVGDGEAADGAARIVPPSALQSAEIAMPPKQAGTSTPARVLSSASAASRDANGTSHAADRSQRSAVKPAATPRAEQGRRRPPTHAQVAATQGSSSGVAMRSSEHAGPAGPVAVAAEPDHMQRDVEIITAIVRASSR